MRKDSDRYKQFTRRTALLAGGKALMLTALLGRMYWLQVVESPRFAVLAEENRINPRLLPPPRGRILDRFGIPLADNRQNYRVVIVREQTRDVAATLARLASIVALDEETMRRILRETARTRAFVPVTVAEDLTWDQVSRIEVNSPDLPGVNIEVGEIRNYRFGAAAAHVLGYVASVSESELDGEPLLELPGFRIGKSGVERVYDKTLRGSAGTSQVEVNAVGRVIRELSRVEAQPGQEIVTTIDIGLQQYVQQRLAPETSASAVVLDTVTGDVLALASSPTFDPNRFANGLSTAEWQRLVTDPLSPLTNKAIAGQYSPGSTFKMIVALAALEMGIEPNHRVTCTGQIIFGNARFHCWKKEGHRSLDMVNAIKHSCDIYFYDVSRRVGIDRMAEMARRFGMGHPAGLGFPGERPGLMPDRNWKLATLGEPWQGGETLVAGIGQGFTLVTPLQLALMTARIANGRSAIVPKLERPASATAGAETPASSLGLSEDHIRLVQEGMARVTNEQGGTAFSARITEPGMAMAGKTGTSQVRRISLSERLTGVRKNEDLPWRQRDHALFVGFAPVGAPRYAAAVVVEHGGGGSRVAAPIARDILVEAQRRNSAGGQDRQVAERGEPT